MSDTQWLWAANRRSQGVFLISRSRKAVSSKPPSLHAFYFQAADTINSTKTSTPDYVTQHTSQPIALFYLALAHALEISCSSSSLAGTGFSQNPTCPLSLLFCLSSSVQLPLPHEEYVSGGKMSE